MTTFCLMLQSRHMFVSASLRPASFVFTCRCGHTLTEYQRIIILKFWKICPELFPPNYLIICPTFSQYGFLISESTFLVSLLEENFKHFQKYSRCFSKISLEFLKNHKSRVFKLPWVSIVEKINRSTWQNLRSVQKMQMIWNSFFLLFLNNFYNENNKKFSQKFE